nr:ATP-binding cassette domain-containing protein [Alloactinosynnema sp. L-07]
MTGPNGSGKTTLLRCVVGAMTPDAGEVRTSLPSMWSGPCVGCRATKDRAGRGLGTPGRYERP